MATVRDMKCTFLSTKPVLPVRDIAEACGWYRRVMGFETVYLHDGDEGEPANYAVLKRDGVEVHLILDEPPPHRQPWTRAGVGYLYLHVSDVEAALQTAITAGTEIARSLKTESWGARAFNIIDPSGNTVHIEQVVKS